MLPLLQLIRSRQQFHGQPMEAFYKYVGISRQAYFQALASQRKEGRMLDEMFESVKAYRTGVDRRAGSRCLYNNLDIKSRFNIGVTKFERLMSEHGQSLVPLRVKVVTTKSCYQSWNYPNLASGLAVNDINELVVGDLCYVAIEKYRYFLFCLTDVFSGRIVGYHLGDRMRAEEGKKAFDMWVLLRKKKNLKHCIHHTDGGSQYFSDLYLSAMKKADLRISVARNCLENGFAEQRNGLFKHHLLPTLSCSAGVGLYREVQRVIYVYNHERKQESLGWLSPVQYELKWSGTGKAGIVLYDLEKRMPSRRFGF